MAQVSQQNEQLNIDSTCAIYMQSWETFPKKATQQKLKNAETGKYF
jgi:hypothetical protein